MNKPSTVGMGVGGTIAAQTIATTKYSIATAIRNKYGDRYMAITVKSDKAYDFYVFGNDATFASTADSGTAAGSLLYSSPANALNGTATTGIDGKTFYVPIATFGFVLPVVYQASGGNAAVTMEYRTFND